MQTTGERCYALKTHMVELSKVLKLPRLQGFTTPITMALNHRLAVRTSELRYCHFAPRLKVMPAPYR
jgi:hypothetical protein